MEIIVVVQSTLARYLLGMMEISKKKSNYMKALLKFPLRMNEQTKAGQKILVNCKLGCLQML